MNTKLDLNMETITELRLMSEQTGTQLFKKLVLIFGSETPVRIAAVKKAWQTRSYEELGAAAHGLKSGAAYLGADRLAFLAAQIEDHCSKNDLSLDFEATISQIEKTFLTAKKILDESCDLKKIA